MRNCAATSCLLREPADDLANGTFAAVQVQKWGVADLSFTGGAAAEAQEYLCKHSERIRRLADLQMERRMRDRKRGKAKTAAFSWIFKREVSLV